MTGQPGMSAPDQPAIVVEGLGVTLRDDERSFCLRVDELSIAPGEAVGLTGASGTGKTLLLELLGLLRPPDPGGRYRVGFDGAGPTELTGHWQSRAGVYEIAALRGRLFGFIPQTGGLLPFLSVAQNVALSQRINGAPDPDHAARLMERLGLEAIAGLHPAQLSIGQRQRVSIARALAHRPKILIADEPTAALDPENSAHAMSLLFEAAREAGCVVIISSHDHDLLGTFALRRYALQLDSDQPPGMVVSRIVPAPQEEEAA